MGKRLDSIIFPEDRDNIREKVKKMLRGEALLPYEFRILTKDGQLRWMMGTVSPLIFNNRPAMLGNCIDITARRQREVLELHSQKLESVGQLASGIAHEINTPTQFVGDNIRFLRDAFEELKPVLNYCQEIAANGESAEVVVPTGMLDSLRRTDFSYLLDEIPLAITQSAEGVERVSKLVHSMKEFSHPGSDTKKDIDLNHAIETTVIISKNVWKYVANLQTDLASDLPSVLCLPADLNQAILNVIVNAAHAIEAKIGRDPEQKGTITIRTRKAEDEEKVMIQIQDTGTGIAPEIRNRIFDPFFTTKEVGHGTGQGLAIVHTIVLERHGGTISFDTEMGEGTTFTIVIPIRAPSVMS